MKRKQKEAIINDLNKKIVFIVGPRQVGKTWLSKDIAKSFNKSLYLNYDNFDDHKMIEKKAWVDDTELIILDELHKMNNWKTYLKGLFDTKNENLKILVTGSARLDTFRHNGDSLVGRYFLHRLLPFSPSEIKEDPLSNDTERFMVRGGFPEPFLAAKDKEADRWRKLYTDGLIRFDILDFENVHNLRSIQLVLEILRTKVGSPISYNSIAEDVNISPHTVKKYIQIFESLYIVFKITPFSKNIARSLVKEPKIYFYDIGLVNGDIGAKIENLTALCLLKHIYWLVDNEGKNIALNYIRTKDKLEIDFCISEDDNPKSFIEVKSSLDVIDKSLKYFSDKYNIPGIQIINNIKRERKEGIIEVRDLLKYLKGLNN